MKGHSEGVQEELRRGALEVLLKFHKEGPNLYHGTNVIAMPLYRRYSLPHRKSRGRRSPSGRVLSDYGRYGCISKEDVRLLMIPLVLRGLVEQVDITTLNGADPLVNEPERGTVRGYRINPQRVKRARIIVRKGRKKK